MYSSHRHKLISCTELYKYMDHGVMGWIRMIAATPVSLTNAAGNFSYHIKIYTFALLKRKHNMGRAAIDSMLGMLLGMGTARYGKTKSYFLGPFSH